MLIQPLSTKSVCTCVQQNNRPPICSLPKTSSQNRSRKIKYRTIPITLSKPPTSNKIKSSTFPPPILSTLSFVFPPLLYLPPLIIDVNNFMRIRIAPDNVFGSSRSLALPRVANESLSPLPKAFGETLHGSNHITAPLCTKEDRKFEPLFDIERGFLSFSLFLDFEPGARGVLAQDGSYLTLHEGPRYLAVRQRAFLAARTINLKQKT